MRNYRTGRSLSLQVPCVCARWPRDLTRANVEIGTPKQRVGEDPASYGSVIPFTKVVGEVGRGGSGGGQVVQTLCLAVAKCIMKCRMALYLIEQRLR